MWKSLLRHYLSGAWTSKNLRSLHRPASRGGRRRPGYRAHLGIEALEQRSLMAAVASPAAELHQLSTFEAPTDQPAAFVAAERAGGKISDGNRSTTAAVDISLKLTQLDGSPMMSLSPGQEFILHVYIKD